MNNQQSQVSNSELKEQLGKIHDAMIRLKSMPDFELFLNEIKENIATWESKLKSPRDMMTIEQVRYAQGFIACADEIINFIANQDGAVTKKQ